MFNESLSMVSDALKHLARSQEVKNYIIKHPELYDIVMRGARSFIGGETLPECLIEVTRLNNLGITCTIDFCGENTTSEPQAEEATLEFIRIINAVAKGDLQSSVSLDLSHIGLSIDSFLLESNLHHIVGHAHERGIEIMISMEESIKEQSILDVYSKLAATYSNLGITIQAYLRGRSYDETILNGDGKIRIVKGAFEESEGVALKRGEELNRRYLDLIENCLLNNRKISVATHDLQMIDTVTSRFSDQFGNIEFEMLHGVNEEKLIELIGKGFHTRTYLIYGKEWYLYYCHRLSENPVNFLKTFVSMVYDVPLSKTGVI